MTRPSLKVHISQPLDSDTNVIETGIPNDEKSDILVYPLLPRRRTRCGLLRGAFGGIG